MDRNYETYAAPAAHTRNDTLASGGILAVMLASILCGAFIGDSAPLVAYTEPAPAVVVAISTANWPPIS